MAYTNKQTAIKKLKSPRADFSSKNFDNFRNDKEVVMAALENNRHSAWWIGSELLADYDFVKYLLSVDVSIARKLSEEFLNSKELALIAIENNADSLEYFAETIRNSDDVINKYLENIHINCRSSLNRIGSKYLTNKVFVLRIIEKLEASIVSEKEANNVNYFMSELTSLLSYELKNDKELASKIIKLSPSSFHKLSFELRSDREFALNYVKVAKSLNGHALTLELRDDKEIALQLVKNDASNFECLSQRLRDDREVVIAATNGKKTGYRNLMQYISKDFRDDKEIVMGALSLDKGDGYLFISDRLKEDREVVELAVSLYGDNLQHVPERFKNDKEIVLLAVKNREYSYKYASKEIKELIQEDNPVKSLETVINFEKLTKELKTIEVNTKAMPRKMKI